MGVQARLCGRPLMTAALTWGMQGHEYEEDRDVYSLAAQCLKQRNFQYRQPRRSHQNYGLNLGMWLRGGERFH